MLSCHNECEGGGLYSSYAEKFFPSLVFHGVESCGVDSEEPVADGSAKACHV